ncbi:YcjF family protein [Kushneria phosphatilytica]|uniref:TIGR01620 family protein n=1 Tax=Kushneria phosphatilytica TaxID=657387 RepID=A0A1S1P098_9GAMM|nr:TIGR01620 family protein [Kushneria phosphatilytica]OHV12868.1 TIGR01620 family protein [Kushneria phosphatilytica]QEL10727.1 TIGR01620 family protein [Kushneria phosphatilytica]
MNDPRPGQQFDASSEEHPAQSHEGSSTFTRFDPAPGYHFPVESSSHPLNQNDVTTPPESALDRALAHPRKRRWGLLGLLGGSLTLGAVQAVEGIRQAWLGNDLLSGAWSVIGFAAVGMAGMALGRELLRLRRLRRHVRLREAVEDDQSERGHALELCEKLRAQMGLDQDDPHWQSFIKARQAHHDDRETRLLFAHHVLAPRDARARALITRMSGETAVMVAISPLTLVDMALMAWRNLRLVDRLAALYGLELGYSSRLALFRSVLANMAFAGASEIASEASMDLLSMNLAERLSTRAGQGLSSGLLTARLGLRAMRMLRPMPFEQDEAPRISDLRRQLWQQMKRVDNNGQKQ